MFRRTANTGRTKRRLGRCLALRCCRRGFLSSPLTGRWKLSARRIRQSFGRPRLHRGEERQAVDWFGTDVHLDPPPCQLGAERSDPAPSDVGADRPSPERANVEGMRPGELCATDGSAWGVPVQARALSEKSRRRPAEPVSPRSLPRCGLTAGSKDASRPRRRSIRLAPRGRPPRGPSGPSRGPGSGTPRSGATARLLRDSAARGATVVAVPPVEPAWRLL